MPKLTILSDEILYHAKIHPEQYSNTLNEEQIKSLHSAMEYICSTSVDLLGDSEKFPEDWLFRHRWGKGKKNQSSVLPNGEKITFLTVGGRTSAIVPAIQKKTGPVSKDANDEDANGTKGSSKRKRGSAQKQEDDSDVEDSQPKKFEQKRQNDQKATKVKEEDKTPDTSGRRRSTRTRK